jgi:hypothetical protein
MPLSPPSPREALHDRVVHCRGYRRADGLWDIEGRMVDTKTYGFPNHDRGEIKAGEPLHEMWVRVTIDDDFLIHAVEASTEFGPFNVCGDIAPAFSALAGLRIGAGFQREVRERLGGVKGCTHLIELFGPLATTAYQTLFPVREKKAAEDAGRSRPKVIDTCHALAADGEVVKRQWPRFHEEKKAR